MCADVERSFVDNLFNLFHVCPSGKEPVCHIQCRAIVVTRRSVLLNLAKAVECRGKHLKPLHCEANVDLNHERGNQHLGDLAKKILEDLKMNMIDSSAQVICFLFYPFA